jgi:signal transduction histidine kinase
VKVIEQPARPRPTQGKQLLKTALFVGGSVLVAAVFLFTHQSVSRLQHEVSTTSKLLAEFSAQASIPASRDPQLQHIFGELIQNIDFPIIITDTLGTPRAWHGIGIAPEFVGSESLDSLSQSLLIAHEPPAARRLTLHAVADSMRRDSVVRVSHVFEVSPVTVARVATIRARVAELDRVHTSIPMSDPRTKQAIGMLHYGEPALMNRLRWMPYLTVAGVGLLLLLGMYGLAGIRQAEKRTIWVGMAKETAHQLGTPLSSLMGWIELLRGHVEMAPSGATVPIPREELAETLDDMERDIDRLNKVAQRFSQIGSAPQLQLQDVTPLVREAVQYFRRRLPQRQGEIELRERYEEVPPINLNRELIEWAVENLLANALSALDKRPGVIEISVERRAETEEVEIVIGDNGRGMSREEQGRAFEPGYSTKRRGWGLGLALARRVVEEYHAGRIGIRHSAPGQGTIMVIRFPT